MDGACLWYRETINECGLLIETTEERGLLGRPRSRWQNNIKIDAKEFELGDVAALIWLTIGTNGGLL